MTLEQDTPLGNISTYTYRDDAGAAHEVLLIPLDRSLLGTENAYPPPTLAADSFSNWVRSGYFFMNGDVLAQLPRNADDLPLDQAADQVTDVFYRDGMVEVYYPVNREKAVCLSWEYAVDEWKAEYVDCTLHDGAIKPDSVEGDATLAWSINPDRYTE